jgi:nitroreductase/NAD-dependent dihydropyrimidine dehydrogenase PreA subunit
MSCNHVVEVNQTLCSSCGLCIKDCLYGCFTLSGAGAEVKSQECLKCGHCVAICPENAISISGFDDIPETIAPNRNLDPKVFLAMIKGRRSTRHFKAQDVPQEIIDLIIEAGRYTPTARNKQRVSYVVLRTNTEVYEKTAASFLRRFQPVVGRFIPYFHVSEVSDQFFFRGAPVVIVVKANTQLDGALAASAMELMARAHGLGVLFNGAFPAVVRFSRRLKRLLQVSPGERVVVALAIGYPDITYSRTAPRERPSVIFD